MGMTDFTDTQSAWFMGSLFVVPGFLDWLAEKFVSIVCPMAFICA